MNDDYLINISMTKHEHDNKTEPYFWSILKYYDSWCNVGCGWAKTPEDAFFEASKYFKSYIES